MDIVDPGIEDYLRTLAPQADQVRGEMEAEARQRDFPIVGPLVGATLELLARAVGARRVMELGSGYGYSAYWFCRAIGSAGEIHLTDGDPNNEPKALDYLRRAGLADPVRFHVGDALEAMGRLEGDFDVIFCDIDKDDYPQAWERARARVRVGGLYLADNVLWSGRVVEGAGADDRRPEWTEAIREHNRAIAADPGFVSAVVPTRDGVMVALRIG